MGSPLRKPDAISWNAAAVKLPEIPMIPAGQDAMSATISAVLPTLAAQLTANVAALSAKENTFSGKVVAAQAAYENSDDAGSQSVGQIVGMLGQVGQQAGQMGQMAGAPAQALGGPTGMFGSLMQQAMQGTQSPGGPSATGAGGGGAAPSGGAAATAGPAGHSPGAGAPQQPRDDAEPQTGESDDREDRQPLHRADDRPWDAASGPQGGESGAAPVPVTPPEARRGDDEAARNL
ncbi:hypothetical protein AU184_13115 [Mycolicibacterium novocastrense]|uniref:hypothetical protein n=1 Tax=Mycolicibacterium novocastrense TaxID=59813 RepID=UPI000749D600|nr:hypothetical protein [Mycolicibacterium novocastrense]KUH76718.1 hypothetical protein AU183_05855 [Mycolicibacterium novocastrense]KUH77954.1 hypothetical protein AU072_08195 [Mycolicibacterium novocastrense]KUH79287.1 hypothetical protein AU184_13115 [Mycolicibacterium novocastrense]